MKNETKNYTLELVIKQLLKVYPSFYEPIVKNATDWIMEDGEILIVLLFGQLSGIVQKEISQDNFDNLEQVFDLMEEYAASNDETLSAAALTGFMEGIFNYSETYDPKYLASLLGPVSREFLKGWEKLHGKDSAWLDEK